MHYDVIDARISPAGHLEVLSKVEVNKLLDKSQGGLYKLFRNCALAVLNSGNYLDDGKELLERYLDTAASRLGYYDEEGQYILEAGEHQLWVGGSSQAKLTEEFKIIE